MNLKYKSILIIVFLLLLHIIMLIFIQFNNSKEFDKYLVIDVQNRYVLSYFPNLKTDVKLSQITFNKYIYYREVKDLKKYDSVITAVVLNFSQEQSNYYNTVVYQETRNNSLMEKKLLDLKFKTDSLFSIFDINSLKFIKNQSVKSTLGFFDYQYLFQNQGHELNQEVDTLLKNGSSVNGINGVQSVVMAQNPFKRFIFDQNSKKIVIYRDDKKKLENVLLATQKQKENQLYVFSHHLLGNNKSEKEFIRKNEQMVLFLTDLLIQFENVVIDFANKTSQNLLNQRRIEEEKRKNLIFFIAFIILALLLMLYIHVYKVFWVKTRLKEVNFQIQEDLILKNKVLSLLTHEIKTPLSVISMSSYLISEKIVDEEVKGIFASIQYTSNALTLIANQALELVRSGNSEELTFDYSNFDVDFEIKEIVKSLRLVAQSANIDLRLHTELEGAFFVSYDKVRLYQLLYNLIGNALKFAKTKIDVCIVKTSSNLLIEISDDGKGLKQDDLDHVFEFNYQGKHSKDVDHLSMGLGMYLCKRIIEKSSGTIAVSNLKPSGIKVSFTLNVKKALF
jgi:signal transduction histidine kinase